MQPTLTQVPPTPQVVPCGEGFTKSATATRLDLSLAGVVLEMDRTSGREAVVRGRSKGDLP